MKQLNYKGYTLRFMFVESDEYKVWLITKTNNRYDWASERRLADAKKLIDSGEIYF